MLRMLISGAAILLLILSFAVCSVLRPLRMVGALASNGLQVVKGATPGHGEGLMNYDTVYQP